MNTSKIQFILNLLRAKGISLFHSASSPLDFGDFENNQFTEEHYEELKKSGGSIILLEPLFHYNIVEYKADKPFEYEHVIVTEKIASKLLAYTNFIT